MSPTTLHDWKTYCNNLAAPQRLATREVRIGEVGIGGNNPIRVQSMTTTDTLDTQATVEQSIRMIEAGCELVRITAPSKKEAENLRHIKAELVKRGYRTPLVADIHFTPNAAEIAADYVEKVRINPGNYADKKRFEVLEYTDAAYDAEIERIHERFAPLVQKCKANGVAMRIGTNHGSLSDRILSRYGDTPLGMVESALEFIRICEAHNYHELVISMKASNTRVMVQAYRLLVNKLLERGGPLYPLHLGVTEAGDGEDGRMKSAIGIGSLLADGLGDTVRVSLTEAPEAEMPVGYHLVQYFTPPPKADLPNSVQVPDALDPYAYQRRPTQAVGNVGGDHVPRVIADLSGQTITPAHLAAIGHVYSPALDKWHMNELGADYLYLGATPAPFMLPNGLKALYDASTWAALPEAQRVNAYPVFQSLFEWEQSQAISTLNFLRTTPKEVLENQVLLSKSTRQAEPGVILVLESASSHPLHELRAALFRLWSSDTPAPVVLKWTVPDWALDAQAFQADNYRAVLLVGSALGPLLVDGFGDGVWLTGQTPLNAPELLNRAAFGVLQASRCRMTKTEYISCPSCGRTLFDLEETTARIRARTDHLNGVKIGIMGCIVNGPGEMADADYGYVGSGPGKITLYRGQEVVERNVPSARAVDALIALIASDGNWREPVAVDV